MEKFREYISKPEISFWLPIILVIITAVINFQLTNTRIALMEAEIINLQKDHTDLEKNFNNYVQSSDTFFSQSKKDTADIQVRLAEIQKDIQYIRLNIGK